MGFRSAHRLLLRFALPHLLAVPFAFLACTKKQPEREPGGNSLRTVLEGIADTTTKQVGRLESTAGNCSGVLLCPGVFLSASHCRDAASQFTPASPSDGKPSENRTIDTKSCETKLVWKRNPLISGPAKPGEATEDGLMICNLKNPTTVKDSQIQCVTSDCGHADGDTVKIEGYGHSEKNGGGGDPALWRHDVHEQEPRFPFSYARKVSHAGKAWPAGVPRGQRRPTLRQGWHINLWNTFAW